MKQLSIVSGILVSTNRALALGVLVSLGALAASLVLDLHTAQRSSLQPAPAGLLRVSCKPRFAVHRDASRLVAGLLRLPRAVAEEDEEAS